MTRETVDLVVVLFTTHITHRKMLAAGILLLVILAGLAFVLWRRSARRLPSQDRTT